MKKISLKKTIAMLLAMLIVWGSFVVCKSLEKKTPLSYYNDMILAAQKMQQCMEEIAEEKKRRGITLEETDLNRSGLIGPEDSEIITTIGDLGAKRTAADPNMAALCIRLYNEANLNEGDTIGICITGSFPGFALASLAAADIMNLNVRYICSVGASSFGASNIEFTLPEMLLHLFDKGLISTPPIEITWGGEGDTGINMIGKAFGETAVYEEIENRINKLGYSLNGKMSYEENILWREEVYGNIKCFVSIGGHIMASGRLGQAYSLGEGLIKPQPIRVTESSGLIERYITSGIPVISLVNVKKLCLSYGMQFDPAEIKEFGTSDIYYTRSLSLSSLIL